MKGLREDLVDQVHAHAEVSYSNYFSHNKSSWALIENIFLLNKTHSTVSLSIHRR